MSKKIYAKQVVPECQESPLFLAGGMDTLDGIQFIGNRDCCSHTDHLYDRIVADLEEMRTTWKDENTDWSYEKGHWIGRPAKNSYSVAEALHDFCFSKSLANAEGGDWTEDELAAWKALFENEEYSEEESHLKALEIFTGHEWDTRIIRGCCQSDWQEVWYDTEQWTPEQLTTLETEYFNLGTEWIIHDEEGEPESPEEISGYSVYCTKGYNDDTFKAEIAEVVGGKAEDVILYTFAGFIHIPQYRMS